MGEQTGSLDSMFASVAKYYEEEFDTAVSNLSSLIEPIMIVFMGVTIGGLNDRSLFTNIQRWCNNKLIILHLERIFIYVTFQ